MKRKKAIRRLKGWVKQYAEMEAIENEDGDEDTALFYKHFGQATQDAIDLLRG